MFQQSQDAVKTLAELLARMDQKVITVRPMNLVAESIELLAKHNIGVVVVVDEADGAIGILSERDVIRAIAATGAEVLSRPVDELMTKGIVSGSPTDDLLTSMTQMLRHGFRHLTIVEDGKFLGVVSVRDVLSVWVGKERDKHEHLIEMLGTIRRKSQKEMESDLLVYHNGSP